MSNIVILGAGNVGSNLEKLFEQQGKDKVSTWNSSADRAQLIRALDAADLVFLAIPYTKVFSLDKTVTKALRNKIVIDMTNPLTEDYMGLTTKEISGGEEIARFLSQSIIVKGLNTILAPNHAQGKLNNIPQTAFLASDNKEAADSVAEYLNKAGFNAVYAGALANSFYMESLAELLIQIAYGQNIGTGISLQLIEKNRS